MAREIQEVADFTGDSFQLSVLAEKTDAKTVIMCGVRFMAETVKILSPEKTVYITSPVAGCPMAEQMSKEYIEEVKKAVEEKKEVGMKANEFKGAVEEAVNKKSSLRDSVRK